MHDSRVRIHANVGFHPKIPLVAFPGLVHLRVALLARVLGGAGRSNDRGIDNRVERDSLPQAARRAAPESAGNRAFAHEQLPLLEQGAHGLEELPG